MLYASSSLWCIGAPPVRARFWSKSLKLLVSVRNRQIVMLGMRFGSLTFQKICQGVAPSISAASSSVSGMLCRPAT